MNDIFGKEYVGTKGYIPELDVLRAFAVIFVLVEHWIPRTNFVHFLPNGSIGVTLFFVLSGYLITRILLTAKQKVSEGEGSLKGVFKAFYIRRSIRIFPIYYLSLLILFFFNFQNIRDFFGWFLFYAGNIFFYKEQTATAGLAHLWTLAVEEQFYLIWPFIILLVSYRYLLSSIYIFIILGVVSRIIFYQIGIETGYTAYYSNLTSSCFDSFGVGGLLAYYNVVRKKTFDFNNKRLLTCITITIVIFFLLVINEGIASIILLKLVISLISLFIIGKAITGFNGKWSKEIFQNSILLFIGKISYGIYLYHNFLATGWNQLNAWAVANDYRVPIIDVIIFPQFSNPYINILIYSLITFGLSIISWYWIEQPINKLKKKFSYN